MSSILEGARPDAEDAATRELYLREGFLSLPDQPLKLFRPMSELARVFAEWTGQ